MSENKLMLSESVTKNLPSMVKSELAKMDASKQSEYLEEYKRKQKSNTNGFLLLFLLGMPFGYVGKWGLQILFWLTGGFFFFGYFVMIFFVPSLVRNYNKDLAIEVMRNLASINK
jgi:hypothetical protein